MQALGGGFMKRNTLIAILLVAAFGAPAIVVSAGQRGGRGGNAAPDNVMEPRQLKPGFFLITGAGANTAVRVTPEGLILVDCKNPATATNDIYGALVTQIKTISPLPVKYILNTHHHPDHVGNNQKFVDTGAQVIGLEALKANMASDPRTTDIPGRPSITFAKDYTLKFGGVEVQAHHYGRAHTGDDTIVYFPDLKIVMVSDTITDTNPVVDVANGGGLAEWGQVLDNVLKLDFEIAIPGRGEPRPKADIQAFKVRIDTVVKRVSDAIKAGATKDQLMAQVKTDDVGFTFQKNVFDNLYDELTKAK
jgi:cyclase